MRTKQMLKVFGAELSTGTLDNFRKRASCELTDFAEQLRRLSKLDGINFKVVKDK